MFDHNDHGEGGSWQTRTAMCGSLADMHLFQRRVVLLFTPCLSLFFAHMAGADPVNSVVPAKYHHYVALGDSYAAGPGVGTPDGASGACSRSLDNYPSQIAEKLGLVRGETFLDVSCSGASSYSVTSGEADQLGGQHPAQIDAVTPETDLITITTGADNDGLVSAIFFDCNLRAGASGPEAHTCEDAVKSSSAGDLDESLARTRQSIIDTLEKIHQAAPKATVIVVPYLRLGSQWCEQWQPFNQNDVTFIADIQDRINGVLKTAAATGKARFVDVYSSSTSHGVCSAEPWVQGGGALIGSNIALHPLAAGEDAIAKDVLATLGR